MKKLRTSSLLIFMFLCFSGIIISVLLLAKERYFIPASAGFMTGILSAVFVILTYYSIKNKNTSVFTNMAALFLPGTALVFGIFSVIVVDPYRFMAYTITWSVICFVCSVILFVACGKGIAVKIIIGAMDAFILFAVSSIVLSSVSSVIVSGRRVVSTIDSPDGAYVATIVESTVDKAVQVNTVKKADTVNILIAKLEPWEVTVYTGELENDVKWKNNDTLLINGNEIKANVKQPGPTE